MLLKDPDVLSQWRAYADGGRGYCLGLRAKERLQGGGEGDTFWSNQLLKCVYGQECIVAETRSKVLRRVELANMEPNPEARTSSLIDGASSIVHDCALAAKHEHFREEKEWRLLVTVPPSRLQYRTSTRGITPFILTESLELVEVWTGPGAARTPALAVRVVSDLLRTHGLTSTSVESWTTSFDPSR